MEDNLFYFLVNTNIIFFIVANHFDITLSWDDCSYLVFLNRWLKSGFKPLYLPFFCFWLIWKARNAVIFQDLRHSV